MLGLLLPLAGLATAHAADPIDDVPPLLDRFAFAANANGWYNGDPNVRVLATERGGSFVTSISYILDGGPVQTLTAPEGATRFEISIDLSAHGIHELEVWTRDSAGNESFHQVGTFKVDTVAPHVSLPADRVVEVDEVAVLEYECGDELSGVDRCAGSVASGDRLDTTTPGTFTVPITATDKAGNSASAVFTYTVLGPETTEPKVTMYTDPEPPSGWYREPVSVGFTAWDVSGIIALGWNAEGPVSYSGEVHGRAYGGFTLEADGVSEVWGWAIDAAGNHGETEHRTLRVDTVYPTITMASPTLPPGGEFTVEQGAEVPLDFACADEHSGVESCHAQDDPLLATASTGLDRLPTDELGPRTVTVRALDVAGNETVQTIAYTVVPAENGSDAGADDGNAGADGQGGTGAEPGVQPGAPADGGLASTGSDFPALLWATAAVLALGGGVTTLLSRRRRTVVGSVLPRLSRR